MKRICAAATAVKSFVILLAGEELAEACELGEKIRSAVEQTVMDEAAMLYCIQARSREGQASIPHPVPLRITVSLGVSRLCRDNVSCSLLQQLEAGIAEADRCLYRAKYNGRNSVVCQDAPSFLQE